MMKKILTGLLAAALLTAGTTGAVAAGRSANYTDANGDGVCDNYAAGARPQDGTGRANGFGGGRGR